jgi:hypothetical protein
MSNISVTLKPYRLGALITSDVDWSLEYNLKVAVITSPKKQIRLSTSVLMKRFASISLSRSVFEDGTYRLISVYVDRTLKLAFG